MTWYLLADALWTLTIKYYWLFLALGMFEIYVAQQCYFMEDIFVFVCTRVLWSWHKSTLHWGCLDCPETTLSPDLCEQSETTAWCFFSSSQRTGFLSCNAEYCACFPTCRDVFRTCIISCDQTAVGAYFHQPSWGFTQSFSSCWI